MTDRYRFFYFLCIFSPVLIYDPNFLLAEQTDSSKISVIQQGAVEIGLSGTANTIDGASRISILIRVGTFLKFSGQLTGLELEYMYSHIRSLDIIGLEANLSWQHRWGERPLYPFLALAGGLRQEFLGSFSQVRYPLGINFGLRALLGQRAGIRIEYRFRRIFHDPVVNFSEGKLLIGLSLFFKNKI